MNKTPFTYETEWRVKAAKADFKAIAQKFNIDQVTARLIVNRGFTDDADIDFYLNGTMDTLYDPALMKDMDKAADIMLAKIRDGKKVRIISDYDADGVCSNYILYKGLARVIAHLHPEVTDVSARLDYAIPHRVRDGYGLNINLVNSAKEAGVDTIITCDNGIAAHKEIAYAKELGMTVVVTDHHDVPYDEDESGTRTYRIPPADAVVDHKQTDCPYPEKEMCGAGVAYKLIQLMYRKCGINEKDVQEFVEILGIATVCDVMNLVGENRIFVKESLRRIGNTKNIGLAALLECAGLNGKRIVSYHYGFIIGPCINAAGRLGDAVTSLELLLETDAIRAKERASELYEVNIERKDMTIKGTEVAVEMLENADLASDDASLADRVLVMYIPGMHESLVGIIAGRIKELYYRPVLLFTDSDEPGIIKGSGRSIEGYHMYDAINKCGDMFTKFGGHAMAAGFSLPKEKLTDLRKFLNENCVLTEKELTPKMLIDVPMPLDYITFGLVEELDRLEPFGNANPKPCFAVSGIKIKSARVMGAKKNVMRMALIMANGHTMDCIAFDPDTILENIKEWFGENECDRMLKGLPSAVRLDISYDPDINDFNGSRTLQVKLAKYRKHED